MKNLFRCSVATLLIVLGTTLPVVAARDETTVKGEVVQVQQRLRTANDGEVDQLRVRTRQGEELRLQLGRAGSCPGCVQVGDQIRARVRTGADGQPAQVQSMKVRRNRAMYGYCLESGDLIRQQDRTRARDGSGAGNRSQQQWQGGKGGNGGARIQRQGASRSGTGSPGGSRRCSPGALPSPSLLRR